MGHFFGALPPNKTSLAGGAVRRLSRQTLTRLPLRDGDCISKIWLYFGKFWIFLGTFFDTFFTLNFLPYHLMLSFIFYIIFHISLVEFVILSFSLIRSINQSSLSPVLLSVRFSQSINQLNNYSYLCSLLGSHF